MIKKAIILGAFALSCVSGFSQGTAIFANNSTTLVTTNNTAGNAAGTALLAQGYILGLYVGNAGTAEDSLQLMGTFNLASDGRFAFGTLTNAFVNPAGGNGAFQIRGWSAGFASYELAKASGNQAVLIGKSALWTQDTADPGNASDLPGVIVRGASGFNGLVLTPVPEPTTIAFGLMGLGALGLVRRRK